MHPNNSKMQNLNTKRFVDIFSASKDLGVLRVLSCDPSTPRRAAMLQEMHFRNISQRANLRKRTEEAARYLEATR